jgi:hypothetical protein
VFNATTFGKSTQIPRNTNKDAKNIVASYATELTQSCTLRQTNGTSQEICFSATNTLSCTQPATQSFNKIEINTKDEKNLENNL